MAYARERELEAILSAIPKGKRKLVENVIDISDGNIYRCVCMLDSFGILFTDDELDIIEGAIDYKIKHNSYPELVFI